MATGAGGCGYTVSVAKKQREISAGTQALFPPLSAGPHPMIAPLTDKVGLPTRINTV